MEDVDTGKKASINLPDCEKCSIPATELESGKNLL